MRRFFEGYALRRLPGVVELGAPTAERMSETESSHESAYYTLAQQTLQTLHEDEEKPRPERNMQTSREADLNYNTDNPTLRGGCVEEAWLRPLALDQPQAPRLT